MCPWCHAGEHCASSVYAALSLAMTSWEGTGNVAHRPFTVHSFMPEPWRYAGQVGTRLCLPYYRAHYIFWSCMHRCHSSVRDAMPMQLLPTTMFFFFLDRLVRVLWCHACKYSYNPKGLLAQSVKGAVTHLFVIFMHTTEGMSPRASLQTAFQRLDASK